MRNAGDVIRSPSLIIRRTRRSRENGRSDPNPIATELLQSLAPRPKVVSLHAGVQAVVFVCRIGRALSRDFHLGQATLIVPVQIGKAIPIPRWTLNRPLGRPSCRIVVNRIRTKGGHLVPGVGRRTSSFESGTGSSGKGCTKPTSVRNASSMALKGLKA